MDPIITNLPEEEAPGSIFNDFSQQQQPQETIEVLSSDETDIARLLDFEKGKPGLHAKVLSRLIQRRNLARDSMRQRIDDWDDVDNFLRGRIDLTKPASKGDSTYDFSKREMPYDRAVVVPLTFSILTVRHTQQLSTLLSRNPVFQVEGVGPEDVLSARLIEIVLDYDLRQTNFPLVLHQLLWDVERYGLGVVYVTFEREYGKIISKPKARPENWGLIGSLLKKKLPGIFEPDVEEGIKREYNRALPVNPRRFYPDPRVSIANLQQGEFVGHSWTAGFSQIRQLSMENGGPYFNVKHARKTAKSSTSEHNDTYIRKRQESGGVLDDSDPGIFDLYHLQIKLVPAEWGLGPSEKQEIWWFTWVNDAVIIRAHPCPYDHNEFTYCAAEAIPDFHSIENLGWGELLLGLQRLANWLYNTHIESVRKALNGALLYSPDLINEIDLLNPHPAGHVRMTKMARDMIISGRIQNPSQLVAQLFQNDFTRGHVNDVVQLMEFAQRLSGANDPQQGIPLPARRTLGELQTIMASSSQRIATTARLVDAMALSRCANQMIQNRQQLTELEQWYRIGGDTAKKLLSAGMVDGQKIVNSIDGLRALIGRDDLFGRYDYIPHVGAVVSDLSRDPETWARVLQFLGQVFPIMMNPQIYPDGRVVDVREVFSELARAMGIKDIDRFFIQLQQQPPQMQMAQQGPGQEQQGPVNVVPDEQYMAGVERGDYVTPEELYGGAQ